MKKSQLELVPNFKFIFNPAEKQTLALKSIDKLTFDVDIYQMYLNITLSIAKKDDLLTVTVRYNEEYCESFSDQLYFNLRLVGPKNKTIQCISTTCGVYEDSHLVFDFNISDFLQVESLNVFTSSDLFTLLVDEALLHENWINDTIDNRFIDIKVKDTCFKVGVNILNRNDYFKALLQPYFKDSSQNTPIELLEKDLAPSAVNFCLKYIEIGCITERQFTFFLDIDNCINTAKAADFFLLPDLKVRIIQIIQVYHLNVQNVCKILSLDLIEDEFKKFAVQFLVNNSYIIKTNQIVLDELLCLWGESLNVDDISESDMFEDYQIVNFYELLLRNL